MGRQRAPRRKPYKVEPITTPCEPSGPLAPLHGQTGNTGTCPCGDPVTQEWNDQARDWVTRSNVDGSILRAVPKPPVHPVVMEQMRSNKRITPKMLADWEATHWGWAVIWPFPLHWHRIDPDSIPAYTGECPTCHGWPMQAVADGWKCRPTSRIHLTREPATA
jgi:hypothetical protein